MNTTPQTTAKEISRAVGTELRRTREAKGWSREQLTERLPSKIGERTVLSYEHGTRHMSVPRFDEVCCGLEVPSPVLLSDGLQRAHINLANLVLRVDLRHLLNDWNEKFRSMHQWARNKLNKHKDGIAELPPSSVVDLADFIGCPHLELSAYLAQFVPDRPGDYGQGVVR